MAARLGLLAVLLAALLAVPGTVHAAASKGPSVKLADCDEDAHSATFRSTMRTIPSAERLAMRFTLQARSDDQPAWAAVHAPGFDTWLSARRGRSGFTYAKTVRALPAPGEYRVIVRFRWRDADDATLARRRRTSKVCEQPDPRPDLEPAGLVASGDGFLLTVANVGAGRAPAFAATVSADAGPATRIVDTLAAGETTKLRFDGLRCTPGSAVIATVDPAGEVDEADEAGNVLSVPCPSGS